MGMIRCSRSLYSCATYFNSPKPAFTTFHRSKNPLPMRAHYSSFNGYFRHGRTLFSALLLVVCVALQAAQVCEQDSRAAALNFLRSTSTNFDHLRSEHLQLIHT